MRWPKALYSALSIAAVVMPNREAVSRFMQKRFGLAFNPMTEVVPLIGSKEGIAHLALAYVGDGDVALIPEPGYLA